MYAFGPLPKYKQSGRVIGTHQKIDRVARRRLVVLLPKELEFPSIKDILHFEGSRGPDGIKMKSPGQDEPWHFIDPQNIDTDGPLFTAIRHHQYNLTRALKDNDTLRAAFEAAWLAHAVTDGLTPAHHDPLDKQVNHLRHTDARSANFRSRIVMKGETRQQLIKNNWIYWGAKGIMTTHTLFEAGVASASKPLPFYVAEPTAVELEQIDKERFEAYFISAIKEVSALGMYEQFKKSGWSRTLAQQTTQELMPIIIKSVTLAWYECCQRAAKERR
jgi:hypothetical protein